MAILIQASYMSSIASLKLLSNMNNELKFLDEGTKPAQQRCANIRYQRQYARVKIRKNL